jgi:hypothetical protein
MFRATVNRLVPTSLPCLFKVSLSLQGFLVLTRFPCLCKVILWGYHYIWGPFSMANKPSVAGKCNIEARKNEWEWPMEWFVGSVQDEFLFYSLKARLHGGISRLLTDRTVDRWRDPEYQVILRIWSGSHSHFKLSRNNRNVDPLKGYKNPDFVGFS